MALSSDESHRYWENLVRRTWEALRRTGEFRADCMQVGDTRLSLEETDIRFRRFVEKWGVECNDPDLSYEQVKADVNSWQSVQEGQSKEHVKAACPDIPACFVFLLGRLQGYPGGRDTVVSCQEWEEMLEVLDSKTHGRSSELPVEQWPNALGNWAPPSHIHLTIDIEADPFTIASRVQDYVGILRNIRVQRGFSEPISPRTLQKLKSMDGSRDNPREGGREDFAQDDAVWRVWDMKQLGKTDMEIAEKLWRSELRQGKGRDPKTGEKGKLAQRVHDYNERAKRWIEDYPKRIQHTMAILRGKK